MNFTGWYSLQIVTFLEKLFLGTQQIFKRFEKLIYARIDLQLKIKLITYVSGIDDLSKELEKLQIPGNFFFTNLNEFMK